MDRWTRARFQPCLPLGDNRSLITASEKHIALSRKAASEGAVLLKNTNDFLPLKKGQKIAVFGNAQIDYVKGGGGSGDVTTPYVRNIYEGLQLKQDKITVFQSLSLFYEDYVTKSYQNGGENGRLTEPKIPEKLLDEAAAFTDTAVITICRFSGENWDQHNDAENHYFDLEDEEKEMVRDVLAHFENVVVLLNVGAMIDTSWFADNDKVKAALMLWQGGLEGGLAAADMLVGDETPSGKLVDTCARLFADYPSSEGFHESDDYVKYTEDIFVGYRYFETVPNKKDAVVYPFGYGLSYTSFELSDISVGNNDKNIFVSVKVTNTGKCAGKEVVQIYSSAPIGKLTKPVKELRAFAKTPLLEAGESCVLSLTFAISDMASYDDIGAVEKSAYVMEKGAYTIHVGTSVRDTVCADYIYQLEENQVIQKLTAYCVPRTLDKRMLADGSYMTVEPSAEETKTFPCTYHNEYQPLAKGEKLDFFDVAEGKMTLDAFISHLTDAELMDILVGHASTGICNTGTMGGFNSKYCIPPIATADGPAGVRIYKGKGVTTTAFPVATALACTWNTVLLEEIGKAQALECKENNLQIFLAPALNIHRSPLCGRNFEYYSEDPLIAGKMAAAIVRGVQSQKVVATPKHFACNNKETNRFESDSVLSERALREIYLKGFEICLKEADPKMIMTSYNLINGVRTSESAELIMGILRGEWGYRGMLTTDWSNHAAHYLEVKAGNDIRMPARHTGQLQLPYSLGLITRDEIAACAKRVLEMTLWVE
ncbi:MAG: glycoside hydrolase family 3 C-terminal domain-containing protein [Clostridia bacterium]|nr:glycoside hydrolase family 3 C-terminal domain-containing protein [Clostridia bacterium]